MECTAFGDAPRLTALEIRGTEYAARSPVTSRTAIGASTHGSILDTASPRTCFSDCAALAVPPHAARRAHHRALVRPFPDASHRQQRVRRTWRAPRPARPQGASCRSPLP